MIIYKNRLYSLRSQLKQRRLDALLLTNQTNVFYLTGIRPLPETRELICLLSPNQVYIFARSTFIQQAQKQAKIGKVLEITQSHKINDYLNEFLAKDKILSLGFEADDLTVMALTELKKKTPKFKWIPSEGMVAKLRQIKDQSELIFIKQAVALTDAAFEVIIKKIKPGVREKDLVLELEIFFKKYADGPAFSPIVASGPNSASPHYLSSEKKISNGEMVLLDFGAKVNGYCSDMTRTVFVGKADEKFKRVYNTVFASQTRAIDFILRNDSSDSGSGTTPRMVTRQRPWLLRGVRQEQKVSVKDVDTVARNYIQKQGFPTIPHSLGHCLGLEIHELPRLSPIDNNYLQPSMVFTIEPGVYLPGWGGVRIEDTVIISKDGRLMIPSKSPKKLLEL